MDAGSFKSLQLNAESFFDKVLKKHSSQMQCQKGCSKCCHAEFSIFTWEAKLITVWFQSLSDEQKNKLKSLWKKEQTLGLDAEGKEAKPCAFLYDDSCSIYEARPIICRTQGAPIFFDEKIDVCPLNFKDIELEKADALDLNRLNTLSSFAQMNFEDPEKILYEERIDLSKIKDYLLKL